MEKFRLRDKFEAEILRNIANKCNDISNVTSDILMSECLYFATDKCLELGFFLSDDFKEHIFNEVYAVFDKHFSSNFDKNCCLTLFLCLMSNMNNARRGVRNYYNRLF